MKERDIFDILRLITNYLNKEKIPYMIVGGITLAYYGIPRTTEDIDMLMFLEESKIRKFVDFMKKNDFSINEEDIKTAFQERSHVSIFDNKSIFRIDIKGIYSDLDRNAFSRRKKIHFRDLEMYINAPEDAIIAKLIFGGIKDLEDAKGIIARQREYLDFSYLKERCKKHRVMDKLGEIM